MLGILNRNNNIKPWLFSRMSVPCYKSNAFQLKSLIGIGNQSLSNSTPHHHAYKPKLVARADNKVSLDGITNSNWSDLLMEWSVRQ